MLFFEIEYKKISDRIINFNNLYINNLIKNLIFETFIIYEKI